MAKINKDPNEQLKSDKLGRIYKNKPPPANKQNLAPSDT